MFLPRKLTITFNYEPEMRWRLIVKGKKLTGGLVRLTSGRLFWWSSIWKHFLRPDWQQMFPCKSSDGDKLLRTEALPTTYAAVD
jgi:hypothetical protein